MSKEDLNQGHEDEDEKSETNHDEGSDDDDMSDDEFEAILKGEEDDEDDSGESKKDEEPEGKPKPDFVDNYNEEFNTNFKDIDAIKESQKNLRKAASDKGRESDKPEDKKTGKADGLTDQFAEDILLGRFPQASHVLEELKEEAENTGKNVLEVYKASSFIQKEAAVRAEENDVDTSNNKKINTPDAGTSTSTIDFSRMTTDQFTKYKNKVLSKR